MLASLVLCLKTDFKFDSETEKQRQKERLAAIAIQKNWRMLRIKWNFKQITMACRLIQRGYRGH